MHSKFGLSFVCDGKGMGLGQAGFFSGNVAPFLHHWLLDLPGVAPRPGADLLGDINALLGGLELGNQLGHMLAGSLGLQGTLLLGGVLHNGLDLVVTFRIALLEATSSRGTELPGFLGTAGDRGVLLHLLLGHAADLPGPLGALGVGGVSRGLVLTLLFHLSGALDDVVLVFIHVMKTPSIDTYVYRFYQFGWKTKIIVAFEKCQKTSENIFDLLSSDILSCSTMMQDQVAIYNAVFDIDI